MYVSYLYLAIPRLTGLARASFSIGALELYAPARAPPILRASAFLPVTYGRGREKIAFPIS